MLREFQVFSQHKLNKMSFPNKSKHQISQFDETPIGIPISIPLEQPKKGFKKKHYVEVAVFPMDGHISISTSWHVLTCTPGHNQKSVPTIFSGKSGQFTIWGFSGDFQGIFRGFSGQILNLNFPKNFQGIPGSLKKTQPFWG